MARDQWEALTGDGGTGDGFGSAPGSSRQVAAYSEAAAAAIVELAVALWPAVAGAFEGDGET